MAVLTDIDICSNALVRLGDDSINSFTGSDAAEACGIIYPFVKLTVLTSYPWWITMKKSGLLSRLVIGPETEYKYKFQMPSDRIGAPRKVFDSQTIPAGNQPTFTRFEIYGDKIFSSAEKCLVDYQIEVGESAMPFYIIELLTLATAAEIAIADTDKESLAELFTIKAWGTPSENRRGGQFRVASRLDSQSHRPPRTQNFPLTAVRQGG